MRIISGIRRGRKLLEFDGEFIRPTTDRVKESMFNLIQDKIPGAVIFDAFSGTGALSLEALSRGAEFAVCTDTDVRSIDVIRQNYENCSFTDKCRIIKSTAIEYAMKTDMRFDLIFMDPPYNKGFVTPLLKAVSDRMLLNDSGIIVLESDCVDETIDFCGFNVVKERRYGRTVVTVLELNSKR